MSIQEPSPAFLFFSPENRLNHPLRFVRMMHTKREIVSARLNCITEHLRSERCDVDVYIIRETP